MCRRGSGKEEGGEGRREEREGREEKGREGKME